MRTAVSVPNILGSILVLGILTGCATVPTAELTAPAACPGIGCSFVALDKNGFEARVAQAFSLPASLSPDDLHNGIAALMDDVSVLTSNVTIAAAAVDFRDVPAAGRWLADYAAATSHLLQAKGYGVAGDTIGITMLRSTGLEAGVLFLLWDEKTQTFDYGVRPGFVSTGPSYRAKTAEEACGALKWRSR